MAGAVLESACKKLRSTIGDESMKRLNFTGDLQEMLEQLEDIHEVTPYADDWSEFIDDEYWPAIRAAVRDAAYRVCHMVDELQEITVPAAGNKMVKMLARQKNAAVVEPKIKEMHDKMKEIKERLKSIQKESADCSVHDVRAGIQARAAHVGREEDVEKILAQLSAACHSASEGPIILIIHGAQGVGKATMAVTVFQHERFKIYSRIWINLSGMLEVHEIGKDIISQVSDGEEDMSRYGSEDDMDHITKRLHELLRGKKVLLVLHELGDDTSTWKLLKDMLSAGGMSSTDQVIVIATVHTYKQDTGAMEIFGVQPYCLDPLSEEMCCTIIKQAAVRSKDRSAHKEDLEQIAPEVAKLCGGIPMAAQIFGSVLQFRPHREWKELLDYQDFSRRRGPVDTSMQLSYKSMPPDLRSCYAYCGFACSQIGIVKKKDLIHQWIALDLIEPSEALSTTQLAEQYFRRLLDLSLLQIAKPCQTSAKDDVSAISFTMHGEVVLSAIYSAREDFCILGERGTPRYTEHCSYASVPDCNWVQLKSIFPDQTIRALLCLGCSRMKLPDDSFSFARCLRVLELCKSSMPKLPGSICELRHLGYLKLSGWSRLVTLPESIGNLINLLHLDVSACSGLAILPGSFGKLINLVHINLSGCSKLANLPESFGKLTKLVHVDLSGSSALVHLPEVFGKLINMLHINLSGCLALVNLPESFGKLTKLQHLNLSGCPKLVSLPGSFGKLRNLEHINLSSCPGLVNLPGSFGKLTNLAHINLSGCSGLEELPRSFGELTSLVHMNLSGCSGLATLPGSFGDLQNLLHVDLSRCSGLSKLPESFGKLKKLVHLNLSFWSCFEGIQTALGGLTNLQHLNLSHPCCYRADYPHLEGLKEVMGHFIKLKYLNLSMFLNPIFCNQSQVQNSEYIEFIGGFSRLEYLDLSHSIFLCDLPESLDDLNMLHTLDLSGCIRLEKLGARVARMYSLKSIIFTNLKSYQFVVGNDSILNNYGQLADLRCKELEITCLEEMKSVTEARRIRLAEKQKLQKLKICWTVNSERSLEDNTLLGELVPPHSLQGLELHGYSSTCFPDWLNCGISSLNLVEVTLVDIPSCSRLPLLGLLPHLQRVVLRRMGSITRIDAGELSGGNTSAFSRLSKFTIDDMGSLEEFTYYSSGGCEEELLFPVIDELVVNKCPNLSFVPLPPRARRLVISDCNVVMVCWHNRAGTRGVEGPSCICCPVHEVTELVVENCRVYLSHWCLLNHLPGLRSLTIKNCSNLISSPENIGLSTLPKQFGGFRSLRGLHIEACSRFMYLPDSMKYLTSLESMHIIDCESMEELPPWLGNLTSLQTLAIQKCKSIRSLPPSIGELTNLRDLNILDSLRLKYWCEEESNKKILGHIRPKFEETPTSQQGEQHPEIEEDDAEQSE